MASSDNISMAVFCDFENVALGVRDANYEKFDIRPVLERLLLKGSIVVKKAYCDWDRYKAFKAPMHEANFEMIEIPHLRQSGKNSADIRLVVDALDLCYTKSHVDTFVIISGDSDFSPLVSKLRENAKRVIGVGVKQSTSDLLVANCDEFIFYDDLVREVRRVAAKRDERKAQPQNNKRPTDDKRKEELEARKVQALEMVVETFDALTSERGDTGKIWASLLKDTLKRRRPDFSETYYGFRTFGNLLEEAQSRGLFEFGRDEKSGTYVFRSTNAPVTMPAPELGMGNSGGNSGSDSGGEEMDVQPDEDSAAETRQEPRRRSRGGRNKGAGRAEAAEQPLPEAVEPEPAEQEQDADLADLAEPVEARPEPRGRGRGGRNSYRAAAAAAAPEAAVPELIEEEAEVAPALQEVQEPEPEAPAAEEAEVKPAAKGRGRAPRKPAARKAAAASLDAVAAPAEPAPMPVAEVREVRPEVLAPVVSDPYDEDDDTSDDVDGNVAEGAIVRKKSTRPARKPAARNAAPRGRRPSKAKE